MREEQRVCIVLYKQVDRSYRYAVLKRVKNWEGWELVKGHIDDDADNAVAAAENELHEEAGIRNEDITALEQLDYTLEWSYEKDGETVHTTCTCFAVEVVSDVFIDVSENPHNEHDKGHFLNYRDAHAILAYENQQDLLEHVHNQLTTV